MWWDEDVVAEEDSGRKTVLSMVFSLSLFAIGSFCTGIEQRVNVQMNILYH